MQWNPWAAIRQRDKQIDFLNRELALCRQLAREGRREIERLKFHLKISEAGHEDRIAEERSPAESVGRKGR